MFKMAFYMDGRRDELFRILIYPCESAQSVVILNFPGQSISETPVVRPR